MSGTTCARRIAGVVSLMLGALALSTVPSVALEFQRRPLDPQATKWIEGHFPKGTLTDGIQAAAWSGHVESGQGPLDIVRVTSVASCERNGKDEVELCSTVILGKGGATLFSGATCGQGADWSFAPDGKSFTSCGATHVIGDAG